MTDFGMTRFMTRASVFGKCREPSGQARYQAYCRSDYLCAAEEWRFAEHACQWVGRSYAKGATAIRGAADSVAVDVLPVQATGVTAFTALLPLQAMKDVAHAAASCLPIDQNNAERRWIGWHDGGESH
jgi:hypothetical protein